MAIHPEADGASETRLRFVAAGHHPPLLAYRVGLHAGSRHQPDRAYLFADAGTHRRDGAEESFWGRCAYVGVAGADRKLDADLYRRAGRFAGLVGAGCRVA